MSKGMYCSASQWIDSASSSGLIWGRLIFLTMTALPETLVATSCGLDLLRGEQPLDGVDDRAGVHDGAVDDRLRRQRLHADVHELVLGAALAAGLQLDGLDGGRADVEADEPLLLAEQSHESLLSLTDGGCSPTRLTVTRRRLRNGTETRYDFTKKS